MGHHHDHHGADASDGKLVFAVAINLGLTVAQVIGGILSGSLALIADALHNFSDAMSLVIAAVARRIARRPADQNMTFGYGRAEVVAALINYTTLILMGFYLAYEAVMRFVSPEPVVGWFMVVVAGIALAVDLATAALTYTMAKDSVNIRAAFLHNLADALGSVAVIVAGVLILVFDWWVIDPLVTLGIAGYILWMSLREIGPVIRILMLARPDGVAVEDVMGTLRSVEGVAKVYHLHLWMLQEHTSAVDVHVVIVDWDAAERVRADIRAALEGVHGIGHITLELEPAQG